jgi:hypothetical protein
LAQGTTIDLRGNFGVFVGDVICLTVFSGNSSRKKRFSNLPLQFAHVHHQIFSIIYCMPRFFGSFISNLGDWIQGSRAAEHLSSATYFSNLLEHKDRRLKIKLTLSLILRVNLRLGGYSIWSASLIAPHIKKTGQLLGA